MNRIRVVVIIHGYYPRVGGAERQLQFLAPRLRELGIDIYILTRRYDSKLKPFEVIDGVPVYRLPAPGPKAVASLIFTLFALLEIARLKPQVNHAHEFLSPSTVALIAERWLKIPFAVTLHRSGPIGDVQKLQRKHSGRIRLDSLQKQTGAFVVISQEIDEELKGIGITPDRMVLIPNGVDVNQFSPPTFEEKRTIRSRLNISEDALVAIFTGRFVPEKRVERLLAVWPKIRESFPNAELLLVGNGVEESHLKTLAGQGTHFLGSVANVTPYLQASDLFILPSSAEGLSVALLEAMACGVPALITDVGGAREVVVHGETGWLIPPDQNQDLEDGILRLLGDKDLRARIASAGRQRVVEAFSVDQAVSKLFALYNKLAGEKKK